jgi:hypothetical protein
MGRTFDLDRFRGRRGVALFQGPSKNLCRSRSSSQGLSRIRAANRTSGFRPKPRSPRIRRFPDARHRIKRAVSVCLFRARIPLAMPSRGPCRGSWHVPQNRACIGKTVSCALLVIFQGMSKDVRGRLLRPVPTRVNPAALLTTAIVVRPPMTRRLHMCGTHQFRLR